MDSVGMVLQPVFGAGIGNILTSLRNGIGGWGGIIVGIMGAVALIVAVYKLVTGLISQGQKPTNWLVVILLALVGAILITMSLGDVRKLFKNDDVSTILNGGSASGTDASPFSDGSGS